MIFSMDKITGSTDGRVHCWNTETGAKVTTMSCDHPGPVQCVGFNPKLMMLATACTNMVCVWAGDGGKGGGVFAQTSRYGKVT